MTEQQEHDDLELAVLRQYCHQNQIHPWYDYTTTRGPRKEWHEVDRPPFDTLDEEWERNLDKGVNGWERFDFHEESYWRRYKGHGAKENQTQE